MPSGSDWQLIDDGSFNGVKKFIRSTGEDSVQVRYEGHDAAPIMDANKSAQADGFNKTSEMWHAARIPTSVMYKWFAEHGVKAWDPTHMDGVKKLLNSNEYRYLRVNHFII